MLQNEMKAVLVPRLLEVNQYDIRTITQGLEGNDREIGLALWEATEEVRKVHDRVFAKTKVPYLYALANVDRRVKRVQSRNLAARRIYGRQADEVKNLLKTAQDMSTKTAKTLVRLEEKLSDLEIRSLAAIRDSKKKKPKGL